MARQKLYKPSRGKIVLKPKENSSLENDAYIVPPRMVLGGVDALNMQNYKKVRVSNAFLYGLQSLTLLEKRIVNMLIAQIQRHDRFCFTMSEGVIRTKREIEKRLNTMPYYIHAKDFAEIYGYANVTNAYRDLKKGVASLQGKTVELLISSVSAQCVATKTAQLFSSIKYLPNKGGLEAYFHADLYDHVIWLSSHYTSYSLRLSGTMSNIYSLRIYEMIQSRKDAKRLIMTRERFCTLLGLPDTYRKLHSRCFAKVIKPAIADLQRLGVLCEFGYYRRKNGDVYSFEVDKHDDDLMEHHGLTNEDRTVFAYQTIRRASETEENDAFFFPREAQQRLTDEQWHILLTEICNGVPKEMILGWPPKVFNELLPVLFDHIEKKKQTERLKRETEEVEKAKEEKQNRINNASNSGQKYVESTFQYEYQRNNFIALGTMLQKYFAEHTNKPLLDGIQEWVPNPLERHAYLFYLQEVGDRVSICDAIYHKYAKKEKNYKPWLGGMMSSKMSIDGYNRIMNYCQLYQEKYERYLKEQDENFSIIIP